MKTWKQCLDQRVRQSNVFKAFPHAKSTKSPRTGASWFIITQKTSNHREREGTYCKGRPTHDTLQLKVEVEGVKWSSVRSNI